MTLVLLGLCVAVVAALRGTWSPCGLSMLTQLNPVAEASRGRRWAPTAVCYVLGALGGGALLGAAAAGLAAALSEAGLAPKTLLALAAAAAVLTLIGDRPCRRDGAPFTPRQVNEQWLGRYRRWVYAGGFGAQIGLGVVTYVMSAAVYLAFVFAVLTASPWAAFAICLAFAGTRGCSIALAGWARSPQQLRALLRRLDAAEAVSRWCCLTTEATLAATTACLAAGATALRAVEVVLVVALAAAGIGVARRRVLTSWT